MLIFTHFKTISFLRIEMSWKIGSRAAGNIALNREKVEKKVVANMISKYRDFYSYNHYSTSIFFAGAQITLFGWSDFESSWMGNDIQSKSKKFLISGRFGLQNSGSCTPLPVCYLSPAQCPAVLNMIRFPDHYPTRFCHSEPDPHRTRFRKTQPDQIWISKLH